MTLLWKLMINPGMLRKSGCCGINVSRKYLFGSCLTRHQNIRISRKGRVFIELRRYTSNAIGSDTSISIVRSVKTKKSSELKNLILLAAPEKWTLMKAIAFLLVSSSVTMAVPFCFGKVIDVINTMEKTNMKEQLNQLTFALFVVFLIGGLSNFSRVYLMSKAGHRITQSLRKKAYAAILQQETAMFDKESTGELVGRLSGDTQLISSAVTSNVSDGLRSAIMTIAGVSMMFYVSPSLALLGLAIVPPVVIVAAIFGRVLRRIAKDLQSSFAVLNATAEERISNIRTVKAFAQENREIDRYGTKLQEVLKMCYKESLYRGMFFGMTGLSGNAIVLSVLYNGVFMVSNSEITIGSLSAFLLYAGYVGISLNGLSSAYSELNKALGANARLFELINRQPLIPIQGGQILEKELSGNVTFQNVFFAYPTRETIHVLKGFNLNIDKSSMTAIVGASGSGKSTVASLLLRLYDPTKGSILLDNYDLCLLDPIWVKSQISIVSQEPILFSGSIRDNILYGTESATDSDVEEAAKQAHVLQFTEKMTDGLNTIVGERGITLSGGQRQRVAIARALIKKPRILILDEATSALDAESEYFVQEALERAIRGRTVITIAHRLSTIKNADKIVVLDGGQVAETGTYVELMNLEHGYFKKLVKHQTFA
ncbi:ATP-binding cassette sub-family B member 10, mitochondrial-like [Nylanderia fulva]|uniref:ATP-binding cassette sub-family B member 10, mitochondrial-like n=1 Tax=Nylanderia fulva TaxID=613905 RepID=UPI0010FAE614|nr:ATP-binding cassette sub-family B member 10, mitochondrial-like [Nylanderia fulva]XP_029156706.1 ATP-binding cassette sub-family B member 10, mitochondrial-like [Nylanderia fulva]XP_029156707.1 ATP-binding cassette sub-family B member 10, mitochondrial-like [Nylanderia fulva]XP_029156708.1 ATP-binding cassette sub-family B member 10, mitochondrial-like [Nylanderia fulva]